MALLGYKATRHHLEGSHRMSDSVSSPQRLGAVSGPSPAIGPLTPAIPPAGTLAPLPAVPQAPALPQDTLSRGTPGPASAAAQEAVLNYPPATDDGDPTAFLGRLDVAEAAHTERERLFAGKPTLTLEAWVANANVTHMTPGQLAVMFKSATGGKDVMTPAQFDQVYAGCTLAGETFHTIVRRPMGTESKNAARAIDNDVAAAEVQAQSAAIAQIVATWSPQQQAQFQGLQTLAKDDPQAQRALDLLVSKGALGGEAAAGKALLGALGNLSTSDMAPGLDRATIVRDVLQEIADPVRINQGTFGTCAATATQIMLVVHRPAEYVRLMAGLASPTGTATLATGVPMERVPETLNQAPGDGRSVTSRLFQSAAVQFGSQKPYDYLAAAQDHVEGGAGLTPVGRERLLQNSLGAKVDFTALLPGEDGPTEQAALLAHLQQAASPTNPVSVGVHWGKNAAGGANHVILVTGVDAKNVDVINPQGDQETLSHAEFLARFREAEFVNEGLVPAVAAQQEN
jgi:hypothetical protein